ncbi:MAG: xanthine dehydrogenase family protein molybdopterin-binding subunit [Acidobacteriota bacterium]
MAEYKWPDAEKRTLIGKRISRVDGPPKVSGRAKYNSDVNRPNMLFGKILRSPHAHAKIVSIDTSAAEKMKGVAAVQIINNVGFEIQWAGENIVAVAAIDEPTAEDAIRAIKIQYEILPHYVVDNDPNNAGDRARPTAATTKGDPDKGFAEAEVIHEGEYGLPVITHCCLEPHGSVAEWDGNNLTSFISTQAVSNIAAQIAPPLQIPAGNVRVQQDHIGGGFGSKFGPDTWDVAAAKLAKKAGKPVKIFLERDAELMVAGGRPSLYAKVKIGAKKDGTLTAWESVSWGTGGVGGSGNPNPLMPYIVDIPNQRKQNIGIVNNIGPQRAWRAPTHPQVCYMTMSALDDLAAKLNMDPLDLFLKNKNLLGTRQNVYAEELVIAAEKIAWKKNWHPRGDKTPGYLKRGLGLSIHTWGGGGHASDCDIVIQPDGSVEVKMGTQDLGVGTRTALAIVAGDTLGLPLEAIKISIGDNKYPASGGSGGSTTIGGVSASTRRGCLDALDQIFAKVAPTLGAQPADLEAVGGKIQVKGNPAKSLSWKEACQKLGAAPLTVRGKNPGPGQLTSQGVGGVQMADVTVDIETGIVKINKIVAVQDVGLVINAKLAESQVNGAIIMGVCWALYEEKVMDARTGKALNPNMEFYKLAGIGDIGDFEVHLMTGKGYDERGVIGIGEPPAVSPGAAIGNAVANAIGVRVPNLPLTPDRVLAALEKGGRS